MEGQDWQPVVIRKKKPSGSEAKSNSTINQVINLWNLNVIHWTQAFRTGQAQTVRKRNVCDIPILPYISVLFADNAGMNKMSTAGAGKSAVKLENETEELERNTF